VTFEARQWSGLVREDPQASLRKKEDDCAIHCQVSHNEQHIESLMPTNGHHEPPNRIEQIAPENTPRRALGDTHAAQRQRNQRDDESA